VDSRWEKLVAAKNHKAKVSSTTEKKSRKQGQAAAAQGKLAPAFLKETECL
jgi:hypothetical protein